MRALFFIVTLLILPVQAKVTLDDVRVIAPKVNVVKKKKVRQSFHGKKIVTEQTILISTKPTENNKEVQSYISQIVDRLNKELWPKLKKSKDKNQVLFRFQIQEKGFFDVLNIKSDNIQNNQIIEQWLQEVDQFLPLKEALGQKELQLEFKFVLK